MTDFENLLKWARENQARGCDRESMRNTALNGGWNSQLIDQVLSVAFGDPQTLTQQNLNEAVPGSKLFDNRNSVVINDRIIKIAFTSNLPRLILFENFLSDDECDQLIELSKSSLTRSSGFNSTSGVSEVTEARTSSGTFFRRWSHPLVIEIDQRISTLVDWPIEKGEDLQILRYENGEQYIPHHDFFHEEYQGSASVLQRGGNRIATFLMYLATPEQGGSTSFPETGLNVHPQKGNAILFSYPTPTADTRTLHGGSPVIQGQKFVATKWLRRGEYQ